MVYSVKEAFYTLQGEGANTGHAAVFCRFTGCNLWSGREKDRADSICKFCDTDFIGTDGEGGGKFTNAPQLAQHILDIWKEGTKSCITPLVVCTGGEPALQLDKALVDELHALGIRIAIETNGTLALPENIDWVCVSPKSTAELKIRTGDELKLVYPQNDALPMKFEGLNFRHFFLQPMDSNDSIENTNKSIEYCKKNPKWRLGIQMHKVVNIP
ncbi:7-carboxy-7-deazaguanine synthase [Gammaproteobacteria bacterium]|nr:7-carboxy-7-deazaguanine synthase [Gammaproteobacteria bacterium]